MFPGVEAMAWIDLAKSIWVLPGFRIEAAFDNTATGKTSSSSWTTLRTFSYTLPVPLKVFKARLRAQVKGESTSGVGTQTVYFRFVINNFASNYVAVTVPQLTTVTKWIEIIDTMDYTDPQSSLTIELQARSTSSAVYASYQPFQRVEVGFLF